MTKFLAVIGFLGTIALAAHNAWAIPLDGAIGQSSSAKWQSSYMDLNPPRDFKRGERLRIKVRGSAEWVLVRLLPSGASANEPTGVNPTRMRVPAGGTLEVVLGEDHIKTAQISLHAGKEAWGTSLNENNGDISIVSIEVLPQ